MSWIPALVLAAVLTIPGARNFALLRWNPYAGLEFFLVLVPVFVAARLVKPYFKSAARWTDFLQLLNLLYLVFLFPQPLALAFSACWFYAILQWRAKSRRLGWLQGLLLLVPLFLKHSTREIQFWGLSYATFRAFHLLMDDQLLKGLNFRRYVFFVFYFPALLAGPIDRWPRFRDALERSFKRPARDDWAPAFQALALGCTQKYVLGEAVRRYWLPEHLDHPLAWVSSFYAYPLYLYLDFAGYSAMAIGFSLLVGVTLPQNFDRPFLAVNPQDFWRRFHISLGEWLRDYFFKPLYKLSAKWKMSPLARQNISLFLTFLLMGLWNGPRKQYVLSGALFGLYSLVHNTLVYRNKVRGRAPVDTPVRRWASRLLMLHLAALALFIFSGAPFGQ